MCCRGVLTPWNHSIFAITVRVRSFNFYCLGRYLTLPLGLDQDGSLPPFDLSKSTKLKELVFLLYEYAPDVQWISTTLRTVKPQNLRQIAINSRVPFVDPIEETVLQRWRDLDRLLVQLWTSHSILPSVTFPNLNGRDVTSRLLPELTTEGALRFH